MRLLRLSFVVAVAAAVLAPGASAFRFTDEARLAPTGVVGEPYSHRITMAGGCLLVTMRIGPGSLPPGLRLVGSPSDQTQDSWRIEGTPTRAGDYRFWITAGSEWPECRGDSTEEDWTIRVAPAARAAIAIQQSSLPPATVGAAYTARLTASGGGSQQWTVAAGALPAGIRLAPDGTLTGAAQVEGSFAFTARVADGTRSASRPLTLVVRRALAVAAPAGPAGEVGVAARLPVTAVGGVPPYRWAHVAGALPAGIVFDAGAGTFLGTPDDAGRFPVALEVTDAEGRVVRTELTLRVNRRLEVVRWPLTPMTRGRAAVRRMFTSGGVGAKRWKVVRGRFPVGVRMNVFDGRLTGTPRQDGRFAFTVRVTDAHGVTALRTFVLRVRR